jgi:hypothetical protein
VKEVGASQQPFAWITTQPHDRFFQILANMKFIQEQDFLGMKSSGFEFQFLSPDSGTSLCVEDKGSASGYGLGVDFPAFSD